MPVYPSHAGILHRYTSRLVAFEHQRISATAPKSLPTYAAAVAAVQQSSNNSILPTNFILFVSGLGDNLLTVTYPALIASRLPPRWALVEISLSSAGIGWTTSTLQRDASELARAVKYFRDLGSTRLGDNQSTHQQSKIVIMGHSTGSQVSIEYLVGPWREPSIPESTLSRPKVDGVILQAPASDREGVAMEGSLQPGVGESSLEIARDMIAAGKGGEILPLSATGGESVFSAQPSAYRWHSLLDPEGDDDYFSDPAASDEKRLQRVWGSEGLRSRRVPTLALMSGRDEHVPGWVDKHSRLRVWKELVGNLFWDERSGVVEGASHNLNRSADEQRSDLCGRVVDFVEKLDRESEDERKGPVSKGMERKDGEKL